MPFYIGIFTKMEWVYSKTDYYPFGMEMSERKFVSESYRWGFNGMERDDEWKGSGNSYDSPFRLFDPRVSRFFVVDPLTTAYSYLSPYTFAENQPIWAIDLEGLQKYIAISWNDTRHRGIILENKVPEVYHFLHISKNQGGMTMINALKTIDDEIGYMAIFSHGYEFGIFNAQSSGYGLYTNKLSPFYIEGLSTSLEDLAQAIREGEIKFAPGAIIYLGGCNLGTNREYVDPDGRIFTQNFAQQLANITGATVIAIVSDQVTPIDPQELNLVYEPGSPMVNQFYEFRPNQEPVPFGNKVDVIELTRFAIRRVEDRNVELTPIPPIKPSLNQLTSDVNLPSQPTQIDKINIMNMDPKSQGLMNTIVVNVRNIVTTIIGGLLGKNSYKVFCPRF